MHATTTTAATAGAGGLLSAYALDIKRRIVALRSQLPLISSEAPTAWVHVAYTGQWDGHASGPFEFTRATFDEIVANFDGQANPVKLDFDHETVFSDGPTPARGWVHEIELRKVDGKTHLWALVEFGPKAVEFNKGGGYRFCSGVFEFDAVDRVSGDECGCAMSSLALTDEPFIDGQRPIQLSRRAGARAEESMKKDQILALMAISKESLAAALDQIDGDDITPEQLEAAAQFAAAKDGIEPDAEEAPLADKADEEEEPEEDIEASTAPLAEGDEEEEEPEDVATADVPLMDPDADAALAALAPLMEATGLDMAGVTAALSENLDAVAQALSGALQEPAADAPLGALPPSMPDASSLSDESEGMALSLRTTTLALGAVTKERDKLAAEIEKRDADAAAEAVDAYVCSGVILDDAREDMVALYRTNLAGFTRIVASMKPAIETGERTGAEVEQDELPDATAEEEKEPEIISLRNMMTRAGIPLAAINKAVRDRLAARKETRV